jgi:hypothetical protein
MAVSADYNRAENADGEGEAQTTPDKALHIPAVAQKLDVRRR